MALSDDDFWEAVKRGDLPEHAELKRFNPQLVIVYQLDALTKAIKALAKGAKLGRGAAARKKPERKPKVATSKKIPRSDRRTVAAEL